MSIWTSNNRVSLAVGICVVTLAGCGGISIPQTLKPKPDAKTSVTVSSKQVVITGPEGFCVDESSSHIDSEPAFVLMGNCAAISQKSNAKQPAVKALLTASVADRSNEETPLLTQMDDLDQFFRSEQGRTALSQDADPSKVEVLNSFRLDGTYYIHARDKSEAATPGTSDEFWRAYFDVTDRLVSVSVIGFESQPLKPDESLRTLRSFTNEIKMSNGLEPDAAPIGYAENSQPTTSPYETGPDVSQPYQSTGYDAGYDEGNQYENPQPDYQPRRRRVDPVKTLYTLGLIRRLFM